MLPRKAVKAADEFMASFSVKTENDYRVLQFVDKEGVNRSVYFSSGKQMLEFMIHETVWTMADQFKLNEHGRHELNIHLKAWYEPTG